MGNLDKADKIKAPKEGDLYKVISLFGKKFELYYGYYEDKDRHSRYSTPTEIYPNFIKNPIYTSDGIPFVTAFQDTCQYYIKVSDVSDKCIDCKYFEKCEELFGLCKCKERLKK